MKKTKMGMGGNYEKLFPVYIISISQPFFPNLSGVKVIVVIPDIQAFITHDFTHFKCALIYD